MKKLLATSAAALGLAAMLAASTPQPAQACGGFFCSQVPIDQMGEQIIFGIGDDNEISATILINYMGEAEDFAWILPVASQPELSIGSNQAFTTLNWSTQPQFRLDWENGGACGGWFNAPFAAESDADGAAGGGVSVVSQEDVGPFETVVLSSSDAGELVDWLNTNGYDQTPESLPLIEHYVDAGMLFVALKLKQNESAGAIQPITLKFQEADPCVPLVLTQIAATPDMPVLIYTFSENRVVPTNWMHAQINQKKIDWLNWGSNYQDVVNQAVDEARGHAFVTEYAGTSSMLQGQLYSPDRYQLDVLAALSDPAQFVDALLGQGFPRDAAMQSLLRKHIPMPASLVEQGLEERDFYNNLEGYSSELAGQDFDPAAFIADLEERVIAPLQEMQEIWDSRPYLSRLYTTVSPEDMTRDPIFAQNPDLPDVSNIHVATAEATCADDNPEVIEELTITLEDGTVFVLEDVVPTWNGGEFVDPAPTEPAAKTIELIGRTGAPVVVDPMNVAEVDTLLDQKEPEQVLNQLTTGTIAPPVLPPGVDSTGSDGCQGGSNTPWAVFLLGGAALVAVRRRGMTTS